MKQIIKCPICGEETTHYPVSGLSQYANKIIFPEHGNHEEKREPIALIKYQSDIWGDASGGTIINAYFSGLICEKCGHVHIFSTGLAQMIKGEIQHLKNAKVSLEGKIKSLENEVNPLIEKQEYREKEIGRLKNLLASEDITIKQQKRYSQELKSLSNVPYNIKMKIEDSLKELTSLKKELEETEKALKKYE